MQTFGKLSRFATVGALSNTALYGAYLVLVHRGMDPEGAMTLSFLVGVFLNFSAQRRWTFADRSGPAAPFIKYLVVMTACYVLNFAALHEFVDIWRLPHAMVQAGAILVCAIVTFLGQQWWVFKQTERPTDLAGERP